MIALLRYQFALLGHSQRYLPAGLLFLVVLGVLYKDPNAPVPPEFAVSAGGLTVIGCWLTIALVDVEDPVQRLITLSHARGRPALLLSVVATVLLCCLVLTGLALTWAGITHGGLTATELGFGVLAHLSCALLGIAVGLPCSRFLVPRIGYTVLLAMALLAVVLLVRQVPLVNPMLRALVADEGAPAEPVLLGLGATVLTLVASTVAVGLLSRRRS
ncbi:hypothetical protein [Amycolatopsis cihanbeyliensis]|uniref:ABC-2 family transporter n=1 Tax=Amycolatopsis cihanbeyliensis TaxID=1128664 RepID=A0A542DLD5_AMYCI|nr:hypothetical protein [Amycolatopsis cihanbeyliensis]TQJ03911.1 hypothetical protein FB471_3685 [Amycolatopsis cihanbeyliensis]